MGLSAHSSVSGGLLAHLADIHCSWTPRFADGHFIDNGGEPWGRDTCWELLKQGFESLTWWANPAPD